MAIIMDVEEIIKSEETKKDSKLCLAKLRQNANVFVVGFNLTLQTKIRQTTNMETLVKYFHVERSGQEVKVFREQPAMAHSYYERLLAKHGKKIKKVSNISLIKREARRLVARYGEYLLLTREERVKKFFGCKLKCKKCVYYKEECDMFEGLLETVEKIVDLINLKNEEDKKSEQQ